MEWVDRLNQTIAYIEDHLTEEIACEALARLACCSAYHYQRMFAYMAGVPLSEYIRRRRMSLAAVDLQAGEKVLDTALKYGYQSPHRLQPGLPGGPRHPALGGPGARRGGKVLFAPVLYYHHKGSRRNGVSH